MQGSNCGLRNFCQFLELSGLNDLVGGLLRCPTVAEEMELLLPQFGEQDVECLAAHTPNRKISLATKPFTRTSAWCAWILSPSSFFWNNTCEAGCPSWNRALDDGLASLPITVSKATSGTLLRRRKVPKKLVKRPNSKRPSA